MLPCPSCRNELEAVKGPPGSVMACIEGCGGLWFDLNVIKNLDARVMTRGESLLTIEKADGVRIFRDVDHICPRCQGTLLFRHLFIKDLGVEVDQCARCAGLWIDPGETGFLKGKPADAGPGEMKGEIYFARLIAEGVCQMNLGNPEIVESARQIIKVIGYICPPAFFSEINVRLARFHPELTGW